MERSGDRGDAMAAELRDIAGPDLYRRNAFRVIGLPTAASPADMRRRQQQVESVISIDPEMLADLGVGGDADDVRAAFGLVRDDRRRLVHEVFWLWDSPEATCSCPASLHKTHDAAVRRHAEALELEAGSPGKGAGAVWRMAALSWGQVLRDDAYLQHVQERAGRLGDRRLDASEIERLFREGLAAALVKPVLQLAGEADDPAALAEIARGWPAPGHIVDDEIENLAASMLETVRKELERLAESDDPAKTPGAVRREVLPVLRRLKGLQPSGRQTAAAHDETSVVLNNAANELLEEPGGLNERAIIEGLELALDVVADPEGRRAIRTNLAEIKKLFDVLDQVERTAQRLVTRGRLAGARRYLRFLRRRLGGAAGVSVIDHMLDQIDSGRRPSWRKTGRAATVGSRPSTRPPSTRPPSTRPSRQRPHTPRGGARRSGFGELVKLIAVGVVVFLAFTLIKNLVDDDSPETAMLWSARISENAKPKACISTRKGWEADNRVPVVPCDKDHWGEVLGYAPLAGTPSPYPGADQTEALARFVCGRMREHQRLPSGFLVTYRLPTAKDWNSGGNKTFENYTTCVTFRRDGRNIQGGRMSRFPADPPPSQPARMSVTSDEIRFNAPSGTCVKSRPTADDGWRDVQVIDCGQPHWARILGYEVLYPFGARWPGQAAVVAKAQSACAKLDKGPSSADLSVLSLWPGKPHFSKKKSLYATCLQRRPDDQLITG
ncbi:MAG: hypothetical protein ACRDNL_18790 [Spirillospora sp.]